MAKKREMKLKAVVVEFQRKERGRGKKSNVYCYYSNF